MPVGLLDMSRNLLEWWKPVELSINKKKINNRNDADIYRMKSKQLSWIPVVGESSP